MVQLTDELVALLDEEARRQSVSRSAVIRAAVEAHLAGSRERRISELIAAGYRRVPPAHPDGWASFDDLADEAAAEVGQRLDLEERAGGHPPW